MRGSATVSITIANKTYHQKFIIADNITAEGILGMDFMEANKCVLDIAKRQLILEQLEPLALVPSNLSHSSTVSHVIMSRTVTIPGASEIEIMARLPVKEGSWLIEGRNLDKVLIARAVVTLSENGVPIRIANTSAMPVSLYQGTKVATAKLITEASISAASEPLSEKVDYECLEVPLQTPLSADLMKAQKEQFLAVLSHYSDILAKGDNDLGRTNVLKHQIETGVAKTIHQQARRVLLPHCKKVHELLQDMLQRNIISPSKSPWASP